MSLLRSPEALLLVFAVLCLIGLAVYGAFLYFDKRQIRDLVKSLPSPFPNTESRYETIDGVKLHYVCRGKGPDVLLLHGIGANVYTWRLVIPILEKTCRVWAVDMKGFGLSDKPQNVSYDLNEQSELLLKFVDRHQIKNLTVVGNSMGGAIAAGMAVRGPSKIKNLVLMNSAHDSRLFKLRKKDFQLIGRALRPVLPLLTPLMNKQLVRHYMKGLYGRRLEISDADVSAYIAPYATNPAGFAALFAAVESMLDPDLTKKLKETPVPLLILWGARDRLVNVRWGRELHELIAGSEFHIHPTGGHHLQEEEPEWVVGEIEKFIGAT